MTISNLSHAERGVIKGSILGGGSTSETLAGGFVSGDLTMFSGQYERFEDAWARLDEGQRDAVINLRSMIWLGLDWIQEEWTHENFVAGFIRWKYKKLLDEREQVFWDKQPRWTELEEVPDEDQRKFAKYADRKLKPHL